MPFAATFVPCLALPLRPSPLVRGRASAFPRVVRRRARRAAFAASGSPPTVQVGSIVAAQEGARVTIARVTGVASSGDTVDIQPLEEFVRDLYVAGKAAPTYAPAASVRAVRAEFVPSQQGWIVLAQDVDVARTYFESRPAEMRGNVVVEDAPKKVITEEMLQKQRFPKPTRAQAWAGAAISAPLAALFYAGFASVREAYQANPAGEELMSGATSRQIIMFASFAGSVGSLVVGCSLFLYALQYKSEESDGAAGGKGS